MSFIKYQFKNEELVRTNGHIILLLSRETIVKELKFQTIRSDLRVFTYRPTTSIIVKSNGRFFSLDNPCEMICTQTGCRYMIETYQILEIINLNSVKVYEPYVKIYQKSFLEWFRSRPVEFF